MTANTINNEVIQSIKSLEYKLTKDNNWTRPEYKEAEEEYIRFLTLRMLHPSVSIAPTELIDTVWHAHILNTEAYHNDCNIMFGKYLHHVPHLEKEASEENSDSFDNLIRLFPLVHDRNVIMSKAARCEGKACHVPSNCRCR
jgi:hypothetical protein